MSEASRYNGSCHCGAVRYEVALDLSQPVTACNCSMCGRAGTLLTFVPASQFTLLSGENVLRDYRFNTKRIDHVFGGVCGIKSFARGQTRDGSHVVAVNARCLSGVDPDTLEVRKVDGKSL